jgi:putative DNA primase/helicase
MDSITPLDQALNLAELGICVFPVHYIREDGFCTCGNKKCDNPGKHPRTGSGFLDASVNVKIIRGWFTRWPESNIGVATGEKSGIIVLDVDGTEGLKTLGSRALPNTPAVATGRADGGTHYYFQWPGFPIKNLRNMEGKKGLDFRGDGGYVIAPFSKHKSGNTYHWLKAPEGLPGYDGEKAPFAEAPDWLVKLFNRKGSSFGNAEDNSAPQMIFEGMRDVHLTSLAGTMRRRGIPADVIRVALIDYNAKYCKPPLSESQVEKISDSIGRKPSESTQISVSIIDSTLGEIEATDLCRDARLSDVGNAEVFVDLYGERFRYDHSKKKWMVWVDGTGLWKEDNAGYAERAFMSSLRLRDISAHSIPVEANRTALHKWVTKSESQQGIPNGLRRATTLKGVPIATTEFDKDPILLNCLNTTLNLNTGESYEPEAGDFLSKQASVIFDSSAKCPRWETFVVEIFNGDMDLVSYFQRAMGYTLTGLTKEQALFVCHGNGANGKSTALNTISRVLGSYAAATPFDTFEADSRNQYGNDLAALKGKRYVIASESEATRRLAEARVKLVTGQDPISCRFLYGEYFEYIPNFKVWLAVNHKPVIRGTDHGIWRRIHLLPFTQTFGDKPGERPMDKDLDLKLADELPGILNWLISGYSFWRKSGLRPPETVQAATAEYKRENDTIAGWLEDKVAEKPEGRVLAQEAYTDFREYMLGIGEVEKGIPTMKAWSIAMAEKGYQKRRTNRGWEYQGIALGVLRLTENRAN